MIFIAKYTDQGGRKTNEDSCDIFTKGNELCAVVADGLGSYGGGDAASMCAVKEIEKAYRQEAGEWSSERIYRCLSQINTAVYQMQTPTCKMKTTIAVLFVSSTQCRWAHVGDTRIYHFVNNILKDMTLDHSVPQMAVLSGEITQAQIRYHKDRNKLLRALGYQTAIQIDISEPVSIEQDNHAFLLCSDGFWEYVEENEMVATLSEADNPVVWLNKMTVILRSRVPKNHDNNTAVAVWIKNK